MSGEVFLGPASGSDPGGWQLLGSADTDGLVLRDDDGRDLPPLEGLAGKAVTVRMPLSPGILAAFVDASQIVIHGVLRQCGACRAPAVDPWPKDWRMEIAVPAPGHRPELTPHRPDCTAPRPEVMLPGLRVYDASPPNLEEQTCPDYLRLLPPREMFAWRTERKPVPWALAAGCPASGWVHARPSDARPGWHVIVFDTRAEAEARCPGDCSVEAYTGGEPVVPWPAILPTATEGKP